MMKLSKDNFIEKACAKFGDIYDYSLAQYVTSKIPVTIICHTHGKFNQTPSLHLRGQGCIECINHRKRITTSEFIHRSTMVHGTVYDYTATKYHNSRTKVDIICKQHGLFKQRSHDHLNGQGCPSCAVQSQTSTKDQFIDQAHLIHATKYSYDSVVYINSYSTVNIECHAHGMFKQTPSAHLQGCGCPTCTIEDRKIPFDQFVTAARSTHKIVYDYDQTEYDGLTKQITVTCPKHGPTNQTPYDHLNRQFGCKLCAIDSRTKTTEDFITDANEVHEDKYNYSLVEYLTCKKKVLIICSTHGSFEQRPNDHLNGYGCPKCGQIGIYNETRFMKYPRLKNKQGQVYLMRLYSNDENFYKVGITTDIDHRIHTMSHHYTVELECCKHTNMYSAFTIEQELVDKYPRYSPKHKFSGHTECIQLDFITLNEIKLNLQ